MRKTKVLAPIIFCGILFVTTKITGISYWGEQQISTYEFSTLDGIEVIWPKVYLANYSKLKSNKVRSLTEHLEDFVKSILAKGATAQHGQQMRSRVTRIIEGCKFTYWTDISASRVESFLADLRSANFGVQTANYYLKSFKQFCKWVVQDGRASESPVAYLKTPRLLKTDIRHERRALEPDEIRRLLDAALAGPERYDMTGLERYWLYRISIEVGLRRGELRSLKVSSFDLSDPKAPTVTVTAAFSKNRQESVLPLRPQTAAELRDFFRGKLPEAQVFKKITNKTADMLKADLTEAGIPYVDAAGRFLDFHSLRHTTGNLLAAAGVHPKVAQSLMRHSSIDLTMSRYTHIFRGQESEAIAKLPDLSAPSIGQAQGATGTDGKSVLPTGLPRGHGQHNKLVDANGQTSRDMRGKGPSPAAKINKKGRICEESAFWRRKHLCASNIVDAQRGKKLQDFPRILPKFYKIL